MSLLSRADSILVMNYSPEGLLAAGLAVLNMLALATLPQDADLLISKTAIVFFLIADLMALRSAEALVALMKMRILTELLPDGDLKAQRPPGDFLLDKDSAIVKTLKSVVPPQVGSVMIRSLG